MILLRKFPFRPGSGWFLMSLWPVCRATLAGLSCVLMPVAWTQPLQQGPPAMVHPETTEATAAGGSTGLYGNMPGRLVEVSGHRMHIYCRGHWDGPTVILDAGLGGFTLEWAYVQDRLASTMRVCSYDRAGYGWSEDSRMPRLSSHLAEELLELLESADIGPPYVLVGHSFGGYVVRYLAALVPDRVAGMVLVESSHPEQHERLPDVQVHPDDSRRPLRSLLVSRIDPRKLRTLLEKYPRELRATASMLMTSRRALRTLRRESAGFALSAQEVMQLPFPRDLPLAVVSRGSQEWEATPLGVARERIWQQMQVELAGLSPHAVHIIAGMSGHQVHLDEPAAVVDARLSGDGQSRLAVAGERQSPGQARMRGRSGAITGQDQRKVVILRLEMMLHVEVVRSKQTA